MDAMDACDIQTTSCHLCVFVEAKRTQMKAEQNGRWKFVYERRTENRKQNK